MGTTIARWCNGGNDSAVIDYREMSVKKSISDSTKIDNFKEKVEHLEHEELDEQEKIKVTGNDYDSLHLTSFLN